MNCFLLQPSMIFCLCVLKVYSFVTSMITRMEGAKQRKKRKRQPYARLPGKKKDCRVIILQYYWSSPYPWLLRCKHNKDHIETRVSNTTIPSIHQKAGYFFILSHSIFISASMMRVLKVSRWLIRRIWFQGFSFSLAINLV
jgi:hypothetical protein